MYRDNTEMLKNVQRRPAVQSGPVDGIEKSEAKPQACNIPIF